MRWEWIWCASVSDASLRCVSGHWNRFLLVFWSNPRTWLFVRVARVSSFEREIHDENDFVMFLFVRGFGQVADEVEGRLLYVDKGVGEALHYMGGLPFVLQLGARSIYSLENASPLDAI